MMSEPEDPKQLYISLLDEIQAVVQDHLNLNTLSLILYGSYLHERKNLKSSKFLPLESDLDLMLILDTRNENSAEFLRKTTEVLNPLIFEPSYASILDLNIMEVSDFPIPLGASYNTLLLDAASQGALLFGKYNVLEKFTYSQEDIKTASMYHIYNTWENLKTNFLHRDMVRGSELFWMGVDNVLEGAHTYCAWHGKRNLVRMEVVDEITEILKEPYIDTVKKAHQFRYEDNYDLQYPFKYVQECLILLRHMYYDMKNGF
ncbi:MAG: hypothetical protein HeimC3_38830 [Candidatus Heimdallarchaeota archaeon LC_3]|nr:MAG: hypothetical protein HeimC3_38830 [Candidatus Heimdallarchaeota archaeon LC_3]